ncbi:unnamed protein product, partial [Prorocentrum cordatum]
MAGVAAPRVLDNFREAVGARKNSIEATTRLRAERYAAADSHVKSLEEEEQHEALQRFQEFENELVRGSRRRWTTADFEQLQVLGKGGFGTVHLVRSRESQKLMALKQMKKDNYKRKNHRNAREVVQGAYTERDVQLEARNEWIVELFGTFQDRDYVYMVMEFVQGGDLWGHLKRRSGPGDDEYGRFTHDEVVFYTAELLEALDTVHKSGFVHRDIKSENIVLSREGHLKLLDFGLCVGQASKKRDLCGSPPYLAAEIFFDGAAAFSPASDLWALGVVAFECLYGRTLWHAGDLQGEEAFKWLKENVMGKYERVLDTNLRRAQQKGLLTNEMRRIFERLICPRGKRLRADALRREPLFKGLDFGALHELEPPIRPSLSGPCDTSMFPRYPRQALPSPHAGPGVDPALD